MENVLFKNNRREMIRDLLIRGYSQEKIAEKLNVSPRTVRRDVRKIREGSKYWLENLAKGEFVDNYRETLDGLKLDLMELNEMLGEEDMKKDPNLRLKIIKQITEIRGNYCQMLIKGPMVWSINYTLKDRSYEKMPTPIMDCLVEFQK